MSGQAAVETVVVPRTRDLGGFEVRRVLPSAERRMVGPFVFLDQMGPTIFKPGTGIDVRPHPHIGLATVTYLFEGAIVHRDSLGTVQTITPGAVNWMTAGRGIVHSERTDQAARSHENPMSGLQFWVGLPQRDQETDPAFAHHPANSLPVIEDTDKTVRIVVGSAFGKAAPVATRSQMVLADAQLRPGATLPVDATYEERGIYIMNGVAEVDGQSYEAGRLLVIAPGARPTAKAGTDGARLVLIGGEPMDGPRHLYWNFVSSSNERIEQAKQDWKAGRFPAVPGEHEFIPLPD
jgi:redox-sensitive bicupin YhaK (pirin superfamily)